MRLIMKSNIAKPRGNSGGDSPFEIVETADRGNSRKRNTDGAEAFQRQRGVFASFFKTNNGRSDVPPR